MNNASAVRCLFALLVAGGGLFTSISTWGQPSDQTQAVQRVLQSLRQGVSAGEAIRALQGQAAPASPDNGRAADARQFDQAQQQLTLALQAYADRGGVLDPLRARYDVWRAAAQVVQIKLAAEGERLTRSPDGTAYLSRHQKAQAQVLAAIARVQAQLDPLWATDGVSPQRAKVAAVQALDLLRGQITRATQPPILRAQAVPFGGLSLAPRQPVLTPAVSPTYETAAEIAPTPDDRAASEHAPLSDEIVAKARELNNDYVRIYEFVRNTVRNEWYAGSVKGAVGVLRSGAGNDIDQASLLTALLRAAGLNTRYVQGIVELPLERLAAELGVPAAEAAAVPAALTKAGLAFTPVVRGGRVAAVQLARTWVSAYAPYTNYRGALVDASGKTWIPLDPFYKSVSFQASSGFFGRTFAASALTSEYQSRQTAGSFGDYLRQRVTAALSAAGNTGTWQAQRSNATTEPLRLDILPNSLPYAVTVVTRESADLPATEHASVRIRLHQGDRANDPIVLDKTLPMSEALNNRVTLSYGPASVEDHRVALLWGGMDGVPLYLIGLRGQLKVGGDVAAAATERVEPGSNLRLTIELRGPWGVQEVEQTIVAGAYHALVIANDPQRPPSVAAADGEHLGARLLDGLGVYYARQWNDADRDLAGWLDTGIVRPVPAVTLASTAVRPVLLAGVPVTLEWTGVSIDAALRPVDAVGARASDFLSLSALAGSSLEQAVFRDQFAVEAISADRGVQLANEQGTAVLALTASNLNTLESTNHGEPVKAAVRDLVRQGHSVRIPENTLTVAAWTGSVWQAFKDGRAGYFISGGLAGGETVIPPELWPLGFLADAFRAMSTEEANNGPRSGVRVAKLGAGDGQRGTVGQPLPTPHAVVVTDSLGRPVRGALVTFSVVTGDARFAEGGTSLTVPTNAIGIASAMVTLGQSTGVNSVWIMRNPGDPSATQVGSVSVDVLVDSAAGNLRPSEPFFALALPDVLSQLRPTETPATTGWPSQTADVLSLGTEDRYGNPIANADVNFTLNSVPSCPPDGPPGGFRAGAVWNAFVSANACPDGKVLGQCGAPSLSLRSFSNGVVFAGVILSNELGGTNTVNVNSGSVTRQFVYTGSGVCAPSTSSVAYRGSLATWGGELDGSGSIITAVRPGQVYTDPFRVSLYKSEYPYFFDAQGRVRYQPFLNWVEAAGGITSVDVSNGGSAAISGSSFTLRAGPTPARHTSTVNANAVITGIRNTPSGPQEFSENLAISGGGGVLFGVTPRITGVVSRDVPSSVDPAQIHLDAGRFSMYPIDVQYRVEPAEYRNSVNGWIVNVLEDGAEAGYAAGDSQSNVGKATLPRWLGFALNRQYQAQLSTRHTVTNLESERFDLPLQRQKLIASMRAIGATRHVDVTNQRMCGRNGVVAFTLTQDARATLTYQLLGADDQPVGSPQPLVSENSYPTGVNEVELDASRLGNGRFVFTLNARAVADPTLTDEATDSTEVRYKLANSLPVGQVLVKGVNVRNGILTHQTPRLSIPGRGQPFDFTSSYSSAAAGELSTSGANWTHNHDLGLTVNSCGEVSVSAGDSGSVRFFPSSDGTMVPDKGYHGTLIANQADNSWDFYSKDGTQYHYRYLNQRVQWKLMRVTDRNGNTQAYEYDLSAFPEPLVSRVVRSDGRSLSFAYELRQIQRPGRAGGLPSHMLVRVEGNAGQRVTLDYDGQGNLISQAVNGRTTTFAYSTEAVSIADRYRLMRATDARGDSTSYVYGLNPINVTGPDFTIRLDHLTVSDVVSPAGGTLHLEIDPIAWATSRVTTNPGGLTTYTFNSHGSPLTITEPARVGTATTTMTWAANDVLMTSKTDARGVLTQLGYDAQGNLTSETVDGRTTTYTYDVQTTRPYSKSVMTSRTDRNGHTSTYRPDSRGNIEEERLPIGTVRHTYQGNGDLLSTTDANNHTTRFEYDTYGNQSALIAPSGVKAETHRDPRGRVDYTVDGRGHRTTIDYDEQDNPHRQTNAKGDIRRRTFDPLGNKRTEIDEEGRTTAWTYHPGSLVNQITMTGPGGPATRSFTYDGAGNKRTETDWLGRTTTYDYDDALRLQRRTEPRGKVTTYGYDPVGNLLTETTLDRVTTNTYDNMSRRRTTTDAEGHVWTNEYDHNGNRTATIDPLGRRTVMVYDEMNRLKEVNQPLGRSTRYDYDTAGNKTRETDPNGNVTQYTYDADNRLRRTLRADQTEITYEYDEANNLHRQIDAGGGITQHTYDELNRKESTRDQEGHTMTFRYDRVGNLIGEGWPNGNDLVHAYDLFNRRTSTSDTIGSVGAWEHDHNGNLTAETDGNGNRSTHAYDHLNFRTGSSLPGARTLSFVPDVFGNVLESVDARNHRTINRYDRLNRVERTTYADGGVVRIAYDAAGNKRLQTDALERETLYEVNDLNRVITITDPLSGQVRSTYDNVGNLRTQTDKRGTVTEHRYDEMNRPRNTTKAGLEIEALTYTRLGQVETQTDANRNVTTFGHDRRGLVTSTRAPEGATTLTPRNAMGDVERSTDPEGRVTVTAFDERRRVRSVTNPAGERTAYGYDRNNNKTSTVRPGGAQTTYTIDHRNMLTAVNEPLSRSTVYGRDNNGNLSSVTDPNGRVTTHSYDALNRRDSVTYPGGAAESFTYDRAGNLRQHIDANGIVVTRTYDTLNRETDKAYNASSDGLVNITTAYDPNSNPRTVTEHYGAGQTRVTTTTYDEFDRPLTVQDGFGAQMVYAYDPNGNRRSLSTQDARITRYGFDGLNRLTGLSGPAGSVQYRHDRSGLTLEQTWSNGTSTSSTYDAARRPLRIQLSRVGTPLNLTDYRYDTNGNRTEERINRPSGAQITTYRYDAADRLTGTLRTEGANSVDTGWGYDAADNRLSETVVTTGAGAGTVTKTYTYNTRNELTHIADSAAGVTTLTYDLQGNLLQKVQGSDTTSFAWSARDLLSSVSRNGTVLGRYASDHTGMRVSKEALNPLQPGAPPRVLRTQWDDENAVQDRDTAGAVIARYDFAGGQPIALWSQEDGNQLLHADALGSVIATTATDGSLKSETLYDAWGNPVLKAGISANKFAYTGHQADAETGLYYFKARYYDPTIGRFISQDPMEGLDDEPASYHRYLYAYGNPLFYTDPTGMYSWSEFTDDAKSVGKGAWREASYGAGMVTGAALGIASSTVEGVVGLAHIAHDLDRMKYGDVEAMRRNAQRVNAIGHAIANPGEMVDNFKAHVDQEETGAARELSEGNAFTAGIVRGKVVGEVGSVLVPGAGLAATGAKGVVKVVGKASAAKAMQGTATVGKVAGEVAEATAVKQTGRMTVEGEAGPGVNGSRNGFPEQKSVPATPEPPGMTKSAGEPIPQAVVPESNPASTAVDKSWKTKIVGQAQKTGTDGHQFRTYREAITEAKKPDVEVVHLDHGYNRGLSLEPKTIAPNRRPDVLSVYNDKSVARIEVQSKTDVPAILRSRNAALDAQLRAEGFKPKPPRVVIPTRKK